MKNDLISRKYMDNVCVEHGVFVFDGKSYVLCADVRKAIREAPTAFDVDKVVEQLEKQKILAEMYKYHGNNLETTMTKEHNTRIVEIVKGGGVNE